MAKKQNISPDITRINRRLLRLARKVVSSVEQSIGALVEQDEELAAQVIAAEPTIDRDEVRIEQACIDRMIQAKSLGADEVRFLLSTLKVLGDLERIGDCAMNIAERLGRFVELEAPALPADLAILANSAYGLIRDAVNAWVAQDVEQARMVMRGDDVTDALYEQLAQDLSARLGSRGAAGHVGRYLDYLIAARNYERIADHATNIAECVIFRVTGRIVRHQAADIPATGAGR
ncbi:MAG: Phosphate-specific transport system accessory protein PhoU [Phycisphaerae bacterium]|nr:Phosphate-specific transport system accessory protein PhoU [Phycisphaerae bacterium]